MSDDLTKRGPQDASKVNIHEEWELAYWSKKFGVTKEKLIQAVKAVGVGAAAVGKHLGHNG
ncbi:DUF3606 domain-containing protein [Janthinobacterium sp. 64]|jgi:hypothetical protein|uniref:DUF3606 domain-containing protein n=1 Tax=Janthinobacterium sp. 64 TaxID=2035208 RepID=UPI000C2C5245|nr:DUF3606 domain-containing protein [Janthinobacterium sp. 64]PKB13813.1 uncharacterized protein DUF3606 [Janthinobacterium sp. 64]